MSKEKQIEEMARTLCGEKEKRCQDCDSYDLCEFWVEASTLHNNGYRKQIEAEWVETDYKTVEHGFVERRGKALKCTNCLHVSKKFDRHMKFCPECGAKMKGGVE